MSSTSEKPVTEKRRKILAVASFGGHLVQLLRILGPLSDKYDIVYVSTAEEARPSIPKDSKYYCLEDFSRTSPWLLAKTTWKCSKIIKEEKPDVLVSTGAAPGLSALLVCKMMGIRSLWIDSIANAEKLSMCGIIATHIASTTLTQWPSLAKGKVKFAGNVLG